MIVVNDLQKAISDFEKSNKNCVIAYGGDGTLLDIAYKTRFKKSIFPVRNYGLCDEHKHCLEELLGKTNAVKSLKQTLHPLLNISLNNFNEKALAEIAIRNSDMTSCMRFDLIVNGSTYMENVICDGIIFATSLGSHGYFKSVTRTIFTGCNIGIGFICPTYGINNLVLNATDKISIKLIRDTTVTVTADKRQFDSMKINAEEQIDISRDYSDIVNVSLFGYDVFCCPKCRKNRNSTIINDQYLG